MQLACLLLHLGCVVDLFRNVTTAFKGRWRSVLCNRFFAHGVSYWGRTLNPLAHIQLSFIGGQLCCCCCCLPCWVLLLPSGCCCCCWAADAVCDAAAAAASAVAAVGLLLPGAHEEFWGWRTRLGACVTNSQARGPDTLCKPEDFALLDDVVLQPCPFCTALNHYQARVHDVLIKLHFSADPSLTHPR